MPRRKGGRRPGGRGNEDAERDPCADSLVPSVLSAGASDYDSTSEAEEGANAAAQLPFRCSPELN